MIKRVWSDLPGFREASFNDNMSVVLADRGKESTDTESTNGLGKTTLLRIIHFCLGADLAKDKVLNHPELEGFTFGIDLILHKQSVSISRNTATPKVVTVSSEILHGLEYDSEKIGVGLARIAVEDWRLALSAKLVPDAKTDGTSRKFVPSFRELSYYFIRVGKDAFVDPLVSYRSQSGASKALTASYLLRLNWHEQQKLHERIETRDAVKAALDALEVAADATGDETIGDLEAERVVLENALKLRREEIGRFNLREDYHDLEERLKDADRALHILINENHSDRKLLEFYVDGATSETQYDPTEAQSILRDAGAVFKPEALRTFEEVAAFHQQVFENRKTFVSAEIRRLRLKIQQREHEISNRSNMKSETLQLLRSSGALEMFVDLQRSTVDLSAKLEGVKERIEQRKRFDRQYDELTAEIASIRSTLKQDLENRREAIDEAIRLFAEFTKFLYGVSGKLGVDVKDKGYRLVFSIDRKGSDGVDQMVVFCFDLIVATLRARRGFEFNSLFHDSSLFADVDPRQYGLALQLAAQVSNQEGFQYVCCLNSGALPIHQLGGLELNELVTLRLSDESDAGRLLGRRLSPYERK